VVAPLLTERVRLGLFRDSIDSTAPEPISG
jgi:hypothetical protein